MKFVCRKCEAFMLFDEVEGVREDSLGVTFGCPQCGARISMVTNAGETQMVRTLGVRLGGRSEAPTPLELTRASLAGASPTPRSEGSAAQETPAESLKKSMGKCPFANVVAGMAPKADAAAQGGGTPTRGGGTPTQPAAHVAWTPEAEERLGRVPDFVRAFAKTMIEDMARQNGSSRVDGALMDTAKEKFM
jgi:hypothetical protein